MHIFGRIYNIHVGVDCSKMLNKGIPTYSECKNIVNDKNAGPYMDLGRERVKIGLLHCYKV